MTSSFVPSQSKETPPSIIPEANSSVSSHFVMGDAMHCYEGDRPTLRSRDEQAQMVAHAMERTDLTYVQRQILWGLGRALIYGDSLNAKQEAAVERMCTAAAKESS